MIRLEREESHLKEKSKTWIWPVAVIALGIVILIAYIVWSKQPLDRIRLYEVDADPQANGAVNLTYHLRWEVLNDSREGPLSWVRLGMANQDFTVTGYGGDIQGEYLWEQDPNYASFSLTRSFQKGETADFWFTVEQRRLLCRNEENGKRPYYDFTPGWFNGIRVDEYRFTWAAEGVEEHNADREESGRLIWEGTLKPGKSRRTTLYMDASWFIQPELVNADFAVVQGNDGPGPNGGVIMMILLGTGFAAYIPYIGRRSYGRGRGYSGYRSRGFFHGGHGGGCACACAGCACACACAGGGRAGCSAKDFTCGGDQSIENMKQEEEEGD